MGRYANYNYGSRQVGKKGEDWRLMNKWKKERRRGVKRGKYGYMNESRGDKEWKTNWEREKKKGIGEHVNTWERKKERQIDR